MYDAIIIGGGPAGLSAALILGRCRRSVLVCDAGQPRNAAAQETHGYLTRDGIAPAEFRKLGQREIAPYGVEFANDEVVRASASSSDDPSHRSSFHVTLNDGRTFTARKLLLATGMRDILPEIDGAAEYYGRGVHHCPYCDGWEHRDRRIIAYGPHVVELALSLRTWSDHITACTDSTHLPPEEFQRLERHDIPVRDEPIIALEGSGGALQRIVFAQGPPLPCDALFFNSRKQQRSILAEQLGCGFTERDEIQTNMRQCTHVPGLYAAGDADGEVQFLIVAAAEGATAATAINHELQEENAARASDPQVKR